MDSPAEIAAYIGYTVGWRAVRFMPERVARRTFRGLADQVWRRRGPGVLQLERNLSRVVPHASPDDLRAMSRESMRSYFRYWSEVFRLPDWPIARVMSDCVVDNEDVFADSLRGGRGLVIAIPHSGNWDILGAFGTRKYAPVASVAEDLKPERLTAKFLSYREDIGMTILTLRKGEDVFGQLVKFVNSGYIVALPADRDLTSNGVPVTFFGEATRMPAGPAALAYDTGCDLLTADLWYAPQVSRAAVRPPIEFNREADRNTAIRAATQVIADRFANGISAHPVDWHMMQKLWLADLDQSRLRASRYDPDAPAD